MHLLLLAATLANAGTLRATLHVADDGALSLVRSATIAGETPSAPGGVEIVNAKGEVLATAELPGLQTHRGLLTPTGHLSAAVPSRLLRVDLPWPEGAVALRVAGEPVRTRLSASPPAPLPAGTALERVHGTGPSGRRADLVIVSDGYLPERREAFEQDVAAITDALLGLEPYTNYGEMLNVWQLYVPSNDASPDPGAGSGPGPNDTPFACAYDCTGIDRLVCCDEQAIIDAIDEVAPFADGVLLLIDSDTLGGSGGLNYAVSFTGTESERVASHELGHSLILLWDEYPYGTEGDPAGFISPNCSPEGEPVPWYHWMDDEHPEIGAFPTCSFSNWVRPTASSCLMNNLYDGYCPVCREHIVKVLHRKMGSRMVERAEPAEGSEVVLGPEQQLTFSVVAALPSHGVSYEWSLDGVVLSTEPTLTLSGADQPLGELRLVMRDETPWVRHDPQLDLVDRLTWQVRYEGAPAQGCGCTSQGDFGWAWLGLLAPLGLRRRHVRR